MISQKKMRKSVNRQGGGSGTGSGLFSVLWPYRGLVFILVMLALGSSSINLIIPGIISRGIDAFTSGRFDALRVTVEFAAASAGIFILTLLQGLLQTVTAERVARDLREKIAGKLSDQSYTFILESNPSKLLTIITSDMDSVKMFVSQAFVNIISSLFVIAGAAVLLIMINWRLALLVLLIVPLIAGAFYIVFTRVRIIFRKSREVIDSLNRIINESILGAALIRVINSQQQESLKFLEKNIVSRDLGLSIVKLFSVLIPVIMFVSNMAAVGILALGGHYVVAGSLSLGNFAAFNSYLMMLIFPVMMIGFMSNIIASATASFGRIKKVMDEPPPKDTGTIRSDLKGNIRVRDVNLSYDGKPVLKNISFEIKGGSKCAIIGPTAAGKSQLLYLLANLLTPDSGSIEFDGIPASNYSGEVFHRQTGFVFQDSVIFNLSLRENIAFTDSVTPESLEKAIATAELNEFIESLPGKLDTMVSERGTSLSGGQKQRIMLARALALDPRILLLDDFTSRVDRKTEDRIMCNIMNNYPGLTLLSVTQKISPVRHFDQLILLMEGEIIATGKHSDLLVSSPEYNQIYGSQKSTHHYEV